MRKRNYNIDVLKGFAIISVILLHTLSWDHRFIIGAPYHMWQAVPVFMFLVGYNLAMSSKLKDLTELNDVYQWPVLKKRLLKILVPYLLIAMVRILWEYFYYDGFEWIPTLSGLLTGEFEHGGYFVPVMIQTILIAPILYAYMQKYKKRNGLILLVSSFVLDWMVMLFDVPGSIYRVLVVRYLFVIVLGIWLALNEKPLNKQLIVFLASMSFIYITIVYYFGIETPLEQYWQAQHAPAYFWTLTIVILVLKYRPINPDNLITNKLIQFGQGSYHIFLVQMIYFWLIVLIDLSLHPLLAVFVNLVICLSIGLLYQKVDQQLLHY